MIEIDMEKISDDRESLVNDAEFVIGDIKNFSAKFADDIREASDAYGKGGLGEIVKMVTDYMIFITARYIYLNANVNQYMSFLNSQIKASPREDTKHIKDVLSKVNNFQQTLISGGVTLDHSLGSLMVEFVEEQITGQELAEQIIKTSQYFIEKLDRSVHELAR